MYAAVDKELGELYYVLLADENAMAQFKVTCDKRGVVPELGLAILKPYWEKIGSPTPNIRQLSTATEESDEEKAQRSARLHAIRTYFMRKDCNLTQKRIDKMRSLIEEVKGYDLPTDEYEAVLEAGIQELESKKEE